MTIEQITDQLVSEETRIHELVEYKQNAIRVKSDNNSWRQVVRWRVRHLATRPPFDMWRGESGAGCIY
jgi:hypothetical protein